MSSSTFLGEVKGTLSRPQEPMVQWRRQYAMLTVIVQCGMSRMSRRHAHFAVRIQRNK